jgi:hypothetical protein
MVLCSQFSIVSLYLSLVRFLNSLVTPFVYPQLCASTDVLHSLELFLAAPLYPALCM